MSLWILLLLAISAGAAPTLDHSIQGTQGLQTLQGPWPSTYLMHPQPLEEEMNFEKLLTLINQQGVTTIEGLLPLLPFQMRDSNYVMMYRSRSLQGATPEAPRILSFTPTARFILSFNGGDPAQRGHNTVEIIQFRMGEDRFEFRELTFDGRNGPKVSEANPKKCLECHQSAARANVDMRPNWEPYNAWPGAVGSADGNVRATFSFLREDNGRRKEPQDDAFIEEQKQEGAIAYAFTKRAGEHPRYRHLERLRPHATTELTDRLAVLNFARVMRLMKENQAVYEGSRELLAAIAYCPNYDVDKVMKPYEIRAPWRYAEIKSNYPLSRQLTWLFEGLGIDTSDWSMDFGTRGRFAASERFGTPSNPLPIYQWAFARAEPRAEALRNLGCAKLVKLAEEKVNAYLHAGAPGAPGPTALRPQAHAENVLQRCARCHVESPGMAPSIPFNDAGSLRGALERSTGSGRTLADEVAYRTSDMATRDEQMPPGARLTPEESAVLKEYFSRLRGR
jgi:hypothetical protein